MQTTFDVNRRFEPGQTLRGRRRQGFCHFWAECSRLQTGNRSRDMLCDPDAVAWQQICSWRLVKASSIPSVEDTRAHATKTLLSASQTQVLTYAKYRLLHYLCEGGSTANSQGVFRYLDEAESSGQKQITQLLPGFLRHKH